ncbi:unnamed protein product [Tuber melanosporum]|uniref:(Perigord truffle) hypothetical protein n=1 Tax=Tuber melanosporum (strain Mel28) TaxID=656061 RepID=D5GP25_TUBMM|nr:uncharacterized protein GSTUM_00011634001 [Tuber melanosporum]CAZ86268.1 unnamed protein product [Tuber melanosporum]
MDGIRCSAGIGSKLLRVWHTSTGDKANGGVNYRSSVLFFSPHTFAPSLVTPIMFTSTDTGTVDGQVVQEVCHDTGYSGMLCLQSALLKGVGMIVRHAAGIGGCATNGTVRYRYRYSSGYEDFTSEGETR